jgi:hypothetical protein
MTRSGVCIAGVSTICFLLNRPAPARAWGAVGHAVVTRAALGACAGLPPWFREAGAALASLSNAPDRWRNLEERIPALEARAPDHFFDLDEWGEEELPADRWAYERRAMRRRVDPAGVGFLPYALLEEYGELVSAFRDARAGRPGGREAALSTAGVLAHLAGDAVVPLHATRHHHGWVGPNPRGFTRNGRVHAWFETDLVVGIDAATVPARPEARRALRDPARTVRDAVADSLAQVPRVYEAELRSRRGDDEAARVLVRERLVFGATLLARLWRTAWVRSGG